MRIARLHLVSARQQRPTLSRADGEAGEVVIALCVHARHFRGLAAGERAACLPAALGDAAPPPARLDPHRACRSRNSRRTYRLGALRGEVVHAHRDQIDADGFVSPALDGDLQLGADAVGGGEEDRILEAGGLGIEHRGEPAQARFSAGTGCGFRGRLDQIDQAFALVDVDARVAVG